MRKRWIITIITTLAVGCAYFATYAIAKNAYENQIQSKIDGVCRDRFYEAISVTYPFLWHSASVISSRADNIKYIARKAGFDRYVFSVLWDSYVNSPEGRMEYCNIFEINFFGSSNACSSLIHGGKSLVEERNTILDLLEAVRLVKSPEDIVEMDSIINAADSARSYVLNFYSNLSIYRDDSHGLNDWKRFDNIKYSSKLMYYENLKKEPFSLYDFFFDNPLDKEIPNY